MELKLSFSCSQAGEEFAVSAHQEGKCFTQSQISRSGPRDGVEHEIVVPWTAAVHVIAEEGEPLWSLVPAHIQLNLPPAGAAREGTHTARCSFYTAIDPESSKRHIAATISQLAPGDDEPSVRKHHFCQETPTKNQKFDFDARFRPRTLSMLSLGSTDSGE